MPRCPDYPHFHIPKWAQYQVPDCGRFIRVDNSALSNPKTAILSNAEFGMLIRIWLLTAMNDEWPPSEPSVLKVCLGCSRDVNGLRTVKRLLSRGMLVENCTSERKKEREREIPDSSECAKPEVCHENDPREEARKAIRIIEGGLTRG